MKTIWILDGLMTVIGSFMVMGGAWWLYLKMLEDKFNQQKEYRKQLENEFKKYGLDGYRYKKVDSEDTYPISSTPKKIISKKEIQRFKKEYPQYAWLYEKKGRM